MVSMVSAKKTQSKHRADHEKKHQINPEIIASIESSETAQSTMRTPRAGPKHSMEECGGTHGRWGPGGISGVVGRPADRGGSSTL